MCQYGAAHALSYVGQKCAISIVVSFLCRAQRAFELRQMLRAVYSCYKLGPQ